MKIDKLQDYLLVFIRFIVSTDEEYSTFFVYAMYNVLCSLNVEHHVCTSVVALLSIGSLLQNIYLCCATAILKLH
jgi:citrate synthase